MAQKLTQEQKDKMAAGRAAAKAAKDAEKNGVQQNTPGGNAPAQAPAGTPEAPKTYTEAEVKAKIDEALANAKPGVSQEQYDALAETVRQMQEQMRSQPAPAAAPAASETITFLFMAEIADDNVEIFGQGGKYGQVTGKFGEVKVPANEIGWFMTDKIRTMLRDRMLIAVSGMSDEQREIYGCNYKDGEILDAKAFVRMLDIPADEMKRIFPKLCRPHQEMFARRFITAHEQGSSQPNVINRELVVALNELSRKDPKNPRKGLFYPVIEAMNVTDATGN